MSQQSIVYSDFFVAGNLAARSFTPPDASITNDAIEGAAGIAYTKVVHKHPARYSQKTGTAVVSETVQIHIANAAGNVVAIEAVCNVAPTTSDTVTIDLKKGNVSTAYASVLTAGITLNSSSVTRTVYSGAITTDSYSDGDSFELVVTASGSSCQGLNVVVWLAESPV